MSSNNVVIIFLKVLCYWKSALFGVPSSVTYVMLWRLNAFIIMKSLLF